jgi:DNA-directed RNA polymerase subunit K/omega
VSIPLNLLVDKDVNTYEVTCLSILNAAKITKNGDKEIEEHGDKVVSAAITQVLNEQVEYESNEEE